MKSTLWSFKQWWVHTEKVFTFTETEQHQGCQQWSISYIQANLSENDQILHFGKFQTDRHVYQMLNILYRLTKFTRKKTKSNKWRGLSRIMLVLISKLSGMLSKALKCHKYLQGYVPAWVQRWSLKWCSSTGVAEILCTNFSLVARGRRWRTRIGVFCCSVSFWRE